MIEIRHWPVQRGMAPNLASDFRAAGFLWLYRTDVGGPAPSHLAMRRHDKTEAASQIREVLI
jgi:hypothetical protein